MASSTTSPRPFAFSNLCKYSSFSRSLAALCSEISSCFLSSSMASSIPDLSLRACFWASTSCRCSWSRKAAMRLFSSASMSLSLLPPPDSTVLTPISLVGAEVLKLPRLHAGGREMLSRPPFCLPSAEVPMSVLAFSSSCMNQVIRGESLDAPECFFSADPRPSISEMTAPMRRAAALPPVVPTLITLGELWVEAGRDSSDISCSTDSRVKPPSCTDLPTRRRIDENFGVGARSARACSTSTSTWTVLEGKPAAAAESVVFWTSGLRTTCFFPFSFELSSSPADLSSLT
mmetsp:Transcript_62089/g.195907  ORF Transcript_62089/g.195907 Transcript_62089/m.195907 type:complete len:289 (-) Transcript_62089:524-1390(-)